jgi:hypothetical protein
MQERERIRPRAASSGPPSGIFDGDEGPGGLATVLNGTYLEQLPVAQMTVAQVRSRFRDRMDIHPRAIALLDGHLAGEDAVVRTGQVLSFIRPSGEKG